MKKILLILSFSFLIFHSALAQPAIQWQKCLGGTLDDWGHCAQQTADGGYIFVGEIYSNNGDVTGFHGGYTDSWVVKLDNNGNIQWQKCLGGTSWDAAYSAQQTTDGGYIVAGYTTSNDGDVTGLHGSAPFADYWVVKLDSNGNIQWQKCLGGTGDDVATSVQQTADGGYIVAGYVGSNDGDVAGYHGNQDYWVVKLDSSGNIHWQKCLGGTASDYATSVDQTTDEGYIIAGGTRSNDGDVSGNHGFDDYWVVKLDSSGTLQWQKCLGGDTLDVAESIIQTNDGGYMVAGFTNSNNNGDITGYHGNEDYWMVKLDSSGNIQWQKCLGGTYYEEAMSVQQTVDGGYIVAGRASSNDGDVTNNHGGWDNWIVKLDSSGSIQWQKCLGGTAEERAYSVQQTADGGYTVAGSTNSNDGNVTGNHGTRDYWIVKLSSFPVSVEEEQSNHDADISPNPFTINTLISFSRPVHSATFSLYNLLGEKVEETTGINGESFQFNRGNLPSRVYVFEVMEKEKIIERGKAVIY